MSSDPEAVFVHSAVEEWRDDILLWVRDCFPDLRLRTVQREILRVAARERTSAWKAPRGSGKSVADALFGLHRLALFQNFVPVLSLTRGQVSDVWKEVQSLFRASELPRLFPDWTLYEDELRTSEPTVRMRTGSAESGPERLESGHGRHGVTLIVDESRASPTPCFQSALGMLVNGPDDRLLATSTAGLPVGWFSRAFTTDRAWWGAVRVYSAFDPELDDVPLVREQADTYARLWGTNDPKFRMDYLSEDNVVGDAAFFDHRKIEESIEREVAYDESEPRVLAVDVARLGGDKTVAALRRGDRLERLIELPKSDLMTTTGNVVRLIREVNDPHPTLVIVDAVGLGAGVLIGSSKLSRRAASRRLAASGRGSSSAALRRRTTTTGSDLRIRRRSPLTSSTFGWSAGGSRCRVTRRRSRSYVAINVRSLPPGSRSSPIRNTSRPTSATRSSWRFRSSRSAARASQRRVLGFWVTDETGRLSRNAPAGTAQKGKRTMRGDGLYLRKNVWQIRFRGPQHGKSSAATTAFRPASKPPALTKTGRKPGRPPNGCLRRSAASGRT